MTDEHREELISAAFDGECVDVEALRDALSTTGGRDAVASLLLLRAAMAADATEPSARLVDARTAERKHGRFWFFGLGPRASLAAAACVAVFLVASSFWLGSNWRASDIGAAPGRRVGPTSGTASIQPPPAKAPALRESISDEGLPPTPTRVLRFTPGVDWHPAS